MEEKMAISLKNLTTSQSKLKKVFPSMKLDKFRISVNLGNDCIFKKDEDEIEIEEEKDYKIKEILSDVNKIYYIQRLKPILIFIENKKICELKLSKDTKISNLRELLNNEIDNINDYLFYNEENEEVEKESEDELTIGELLKEKNKIILKSLNSKKKNYQKPQNQNMPYNLNMNNQNNQNKNSNNEKWYFIYINKKKYETRKFPSDTLLIEMKEKLSYKSKKNLIFLNNDCKVALNEETKTKISEISNTDDEIFLISKKKNNSDSDSESDDNLSKSKGDYNSDDSDENKKDYKL
jgi:hypothetical protein